MTSPSETHTSIAQVSISDGCQKICRVDMMVEADLGLGYVLLWERSLVITCSDYGFLEISQ